MNQGRTKDEPKNAKSQNMRFIKIVTKPEKGWLDYWVVILKNVNFWLVS